MPQAPFAGLDRHTQVSDTAGGMTELDRSGNQVLNHLSNLTLWDTDLHVERTVKFESKRLEIGTKI